MKGKKAFPYASGALVGALAMALATAFVSGEPSASVVATTPTTTQFTAPQLTSGGANDVGQAAAGGVRNALPGTVSAAQTATDEGGAAPGATQLPATSGGSATLTASDIGITPEAITLGILIADVDIEGVDSDELTATQEEQWQVTIDAVNARGGIHGRVLEPVYRSYDALDADEMRAACIYLTEEIKAFTVLNNGGYYGEPIRCVTEQHATPLLGQAGEDRSFYRGNYFTTTPNKDRVLQNLVTRLHNDGILEGKTIGTLENEGIDKIPVDNSLHPTLKALGYKVAHRAVFSEDFGTAQSQMPVEIQEMRSAGVDFILPAVNLGVMTVWVQTADTQNYRPQYWMSDFACGTCDVYVVAMPERAFDGVQGYTSLRSGEARVGLPEAEHDKVCREQFEAGTGRSLDRQDSDYGGTVQSCGIMNVFEGAATRAGPNLTRAGLVQALQGFGQFNVPFGPLGSFGPGKFDAPDESRTVVHRSDCRCYRPVNDFTRDPF